MLLGVRAGIAWLAAPLSVWVLGYGFLGMKRAYAQGWVVTGVKAAILGFVYLAILTGALTVTTLISVLLA